MRIEDNVDNDAGFSVIADDDEHDENDDEDEDKYKAEGGFLACTCASHTAPTLEDFNLPLAEEEDGSSNENYNCDYDNDNDGNGNDGGDNGNNHDHTYGEEEERRQLGRPPTGLSDYELLWLRNIERNNTCLAALGLGGNVKRYLTGLEVTEERMRGRRGRSKGR